MSFILGENMSLFKNIFILITVSVSTAFSEPYTRGEIAGNCSMQLNQSFQVTHNGAIDSSGAKLSNVSEGDGGATWPVSYCPNKGSNNLVECAAGWKPIVRSVVQMDCRASSTQPMCWTYWVVNACAKL